MEYELSSEDMQRMRRLLEEVQGRLEEMARIAARVAGVKLDPRAVRKFVPRPEASHPGASDAPVIDWVEIFDATPQHPEMCVVHYSDGHGVLESPCGTPLTG